MPTVIHPGQVAELLCVTTKTLEKWRDEHKLNPVYIGGRCLNLYPESEINRFLGMDSDGLTWANENFDENGNARGELATAQAESLIQSN